MAVLNLRGVPAETIRRLKVNAASNGVSLKDWCMRLLENYESGNGNRRINESGGLGAIPREPERRENLPRTETNSNSRNHEFNGDSLMSDEYSGIVHDPEFCQDPGCRQCREARIIAAAKR